MNVVIREYGERDLDPCKALWRELTQRHRDIYLDPSIGGDDPAIYFESYLTKADRAGLWVAEINSSVVGMAGLFLTGEEAEIEPVVVKTGFRSQGVGTQLIERLKAEAKQRGASYLSLRPVARNIEAVQCFYRAGFTLLGQIEMFLDLTDASSREWTGDLTLHQCRFKF